MSPQVLDQKVGDVNGDGVPDIVYLTGTTPFPDSPFRENITLWVIDGRTKQRYHTALRTNIGYGPYLFLGDFTGDKVKDILISMSSGGSGGITYNYVYSYLQNKPKIMFDYELFNELYHYQVNYQDGYKVKVIGVETGNTFTIDIQYKGKEYLSGLYNDQGKLLKPISGYVNGLGGLYPIDFRGNGTYDLLAYQRVTGLYNADGLGWLNTYLRWNGTAFASYNQTIQIFG